MAAIARVVLWLLFLVASSPAAAEHRGRPFKKVYAFGDSYTDTGNTRTSSGPLVFNYVSNPPYGLTYFHRPTNRYSDGRIVVDFVAEHLSLPLLPPYRDSSADRAHGICFAVAGATAIRHGYFLENNITFSLVPVSLETQLMWFNRTLKNSDGCDDSVTTPEACEESLGDAFIWIGEMGANDYTSAIGSSIGTATIRSLAVDSVGSFIQALINKGARYIAVQGLPPVGCVTYSFSIASPEDRDEMGCVASANRRIRVHNAATKASIVELRRRNPGTMIVYVDFYNAHLAVLKKSKGFGFKEMYKACCGYGGGYNFDVLNVCGTPSSTACSAPSEYINWDGAHFTEAMNRVLAESFLNGSFSSPRFSVLMAEKLRSG